MKQFLVFTALLIIAALSFDRLAEIPLDVLQRNARTGESGGKLNYYAYTAEDYDGVIMGSSRALNHIDPSYLQGKVFNLGHTSVSIVFQLAALEFLLAKNVKPKSILLHLDLSMYLQAPSDSLQPNSSRLGFLYLHSPTARKLIQMQEPKEALKYGIFHTYKYNGRTTEVMYTGIKSYLRPIGAYSGFEAHPVTSQDSTRVLQLLRTLPYMQGKFSLYQQPYLERFVTLCKQNSIPLVCVTSPYLVENFTEQETIYSYIDNYLRDRGIPYFNFMQHPVPQLNNPKYWHDPAHLNANGADIFSQVLAKSIQKHFPALH